MSDVDQKTKSKKLSELALRIRTARREARLSQQALGDSIGVSDKSVSAYEQGRSVPPFDKLKKIAVQTNRPVSYFTEDNIDEALLSAKLDSIKRELEEVTKLLKKAKK